MEFATGDRLRARGLEWEVLEHEKLEHQWRFRLRCVSGDMAGLEWDIMSPETVEKVAARLRPEHPGPLVAWRLQHIAALLDQVFDGIGVIGGQPGRLKVEPYQLVPLMRALEMPRPRLLLADGVGLGKTIQAGLIAAELITRRLAHRILVVAPAGALLAQWEQELRSRFGLRFTRLTDAASLRDQRRGLELGGNPFNGVALCLTSLDFAKQDRILDDLERAAWDLAIIDEAHHCFAAGPTGGAEATMRRRLAEVVARRSDGLLLLTATPHDGHDAHFASLMALLDPSLVDGHGNLVGLAYRRHMVRRLKSHIRDPASGRPMFRERRIVPIRIEAADIAPPVRVFHAALAAFVVPRLGRGRQDGGYSDALAFVSLLKRSVSTVAACVGTLRAVADRYLAMDAVESRQERLARARALRLWRRRVRRYGVLDAAGEADVEAIEIDSMAADLGAPAVGDPVVMRSADGETRRGLEELIRLGRLAERHDPKLEALLTQVRLIRLAHPLTNILVYTEYADSLVAAVAALRDAVGIAGEILAISGVDPEDTRTRNAERCGEVDGVILVSTDTMAEGLNLQARCFHLIHLDLPYNPNRLEQRNGRIDRYGQAHPPDIRYPYLANTFEEHLLLRLIAKYEKARACLDTMPDTLGLTAAADDLKPGLMAGFAERQATLFDDPAPSVRTIEHAAADAGAVVWRALASDVARAYAGVDQMAVRHGWLNQQSLDGDLGAAGACADWHRVLVSHSTVPAPSVHGPSRAAAVAMLVPDPVTRALSGIDLAAFTIAALEADAGVTQPVGRMTLTGSWASGLDGLPGFDPEAKTVRVTRDPSRVRDDDGHSLAFLGRAHPLVRRAITRTYPWEGRVGVAQAAVNEPISVVLTYVAEVHSASRLERHVFAVRLPAVGVPVELADPAEWLLADHLEPPVEHAETWERHFAAWVTAREPSAQAVAGASMSRIMEAHRSHRADLIARDGVHRQRWLLRRADELCGAAVPGVDDMFGSGPRPKDWRNSGPPFDRLAAYACDGDNPSALRREANDALTLFQDRADESARRSAWSAPVLRPIGMLMLVAPA